MGVDATLRFDLESHFPGDIHDVTSSGPPLKIILFPVNRPGGLVSSDLVHFF